jgi:integrase
MTVLELADLYLERHALVRDDRTIRTLRARLRRPLKDYGDTKLDELETMAGDLATWRSTLPPAFAYQVFSALRQVLAAGVRWRYLSSNPAVDAGANPKPKPRAVRVLTLAEIDALDAELGARYGPIVPFAAATSLRPAEWAGLERRDVNRDGRVLTVRGTKTAGSRREVPLSARALGAIGSHRDSTRRSYFRRRVAGRSTSTAGEGASGRRQSKPLASRSPAGFTTSARPSPRRRSLPA